MIAIIMGVSGSGKSTVGKLLGEKLGCSFHDADDFHPPANIEKMRAGIALNDTDRMPWLNAIREFMLSRLKEGKSAVIACSALKNSYREILLKDNSEVHFFHFKGNFDLIIERLEHRSGHFMNPKLLESQFATLEDPGEECDVSVDRSPEAIVQDILQRLTKAN
ncbi:MAG: gluconate kinase [Verrucomicrobiales bacterium]|nr:gluconate kinase [Verrucomicrobiales bacterium]